MTGKLVRLFNPRRDRWQKHFAWQGPLIVSRSSIGRATIQVLNMNEPSAVEVRLALIEEGIFPPT